MILAIAGATGKLGQFVAAACLSTPFRGSFSEVRILTRDPSKPLIKELYHAGATIVKISYDTERSITELEEALLEVKALIDCQSGGPDAHKNQDILLEAAIKSPSLKYYIPSQFGIDLRVLDFENPEFDLKIKRDQHARSAGTLKLVSVYPGLFLEDTFSPWLGFDVENHQFVAVGSGDVRFSLTAKVDVGLAVASIASSLGQGIAIPEHVRISGTSTTVNQAAELFGNASSDKHQTIKVETVPLAEFKAEGIKKPFPGCLLDGLRVLIGEGKLDHTQDNHNEIVNPKTTWKFTSIEDYVKSVAGGSSQVTPSALHQVKNKIGLPELSHSQYTADISQAPQQTKAGSTVADTSLP